MSDDVERCSALVSSAGMWSQFHRCSRAGSITRNKKPYCKQHDPDAVKEKRAAKEAAWDAKWKSNKEQWKIEEENTRVAEYLRSKRPRLFAILLTKINQEVKP